MLYTLKILIFILIFSLDAQAAFNKADVDAIQKKAAVDREKYQKIIDIAKKNAEAEQTHQKFVDDINKQVEADKEKYQSIVDVAQDNASAYKEQAKNIVERIENNPIPLSEEKPEAHNVVGQILAKYKQLKSISTNGKTKDGMYIFVSFSMPKSLLETLDKTAHQIGARLVIRGLINNSFKETIIYSKGMAVDINPVLFEDFAVNLVPAFVVVEGKTYDKIVGNVSIPYVLEQFTSSGDTKALSAQIMKRLRHDG